jgi:hypothetical protein
MNPLEQTAHTQHQEVMEDVNPTKKQNVNHVIITNISKIREKTRKTNVKTY